MARKKNEPPTDSASPEEPEEAFVLEEMPGNVTLKRKRGRPISKWNPQYITIAKAMLRKGATIAEIAKAFDVKDSTVWKWRQSYEEFDEAFRELGSVYDERIERTLAERAAGYSYIAQKPMIVKGQVQIVEYWEHCPPDITALRHWLGVRMGEKWRVKEQVEVSGDEVFKEVWQNLKSKRDEAEK